MSEQVTPRAPMTIGQLAATKFHAFQGMFQKEQTEAALYIERMASLTNVNVQSWDILTVFEGQGTSGKLIVTDKRAINKRLYEYADLMKQELPGTLLGDQKKLEEAGLKMLHRTRKIQEDSIKANMRQIRYDANNAYTRYLDHMKRAWEYEKRLLVLDVAPPRDMLEEVKTISKAGFWKYESFSEVEQFIVFTNVNPVVMVLKNQSAGQNIQVNLGYFTAKVHFGDQSMVQLHRGEGNISADDYYHPYVSNSGRICWGNANGAAEELLFSRQYAAVMELLSALMTTYSPDATPYASLESFHRKVVGTTDEDGDDGRCGLCNRSPSHCDCWSCDVCGEMFPEADGCNCCTGCNNTENNCECCSVCSEIGDDCGRCRECDRHDGHEIECAEHTREVANESSPF